MRTAKTVVRSPHFVVRAVECADDRARWSGPEAASAAEIVLVRRGRFRLDHRGVRLMADTTTGYLHRPGEEVRFAHPAGGDACTSVEFTGDALTAGMETAPAPAVRVDARLELAHRLLLRAGADRAFAAAEAVLGLLRLVLRGQPDDLPAPGRRELADRAREAVAAGEPAAADLVSLARLLETSPSHLSRTFRHHVGMPLSRYRNRVRVSRALARIDGGERDLAGLAAGLGFSDQAHFTRVMRDELGRTPGRVLRVLGGDGAPEPPGRPAVRTPGGEAGRGRGRSGGR
ncbi:helix-turn-helix domain-containing protein [Actinomadura sp. WAC 06369]|uniref:helix-turn-helix domain-containing protein n=1 Tax=Actinomadura sp. WAC 06369 TaxID=2203193 RepID=UPI0018F38D1B|nr:AraC family transcriptional regulator [Actinomadura sp. WAC 06369]